MRMKVIDLRPGIFEMTWGFFSFFITPYFPVVSFFNDVIAIIITSVYVVINASDLAILGTQTPEISLHLSHIPCVLKKNVRSKFSKYQMRPFKKCSDRTKSPSARATESRRTCTHAQSTVNSVQRRVPRGRLFRNGSSRAFFSVSQGILTTFLVDERNLVSKTQ